MIFKPEDIEIFITTYNRAALLKETLISIVNQTVKGFKIIVLDNASTDSTKEIVKEFEIYGVEFITSSENLGAEVNFNRAKDLASGKWLMVFHDDDLIHPRYIENALKLINKYPDISLIAATLSSKEQPPKNENWQKVRAKGCYCNNLEDFAAYLYCGKNFDYASTIYRTEIFKKIKTKCSIYGKVADKPFVLDAAKYGPSIVMKDKYIKCGIHKGQDSSDYKSGPFIEQIIELNKKFHEILGDNIFTKNGRVFTARNFKWLINEFYWCSVNKEKMSEYEFTEKALKEHATTNLSVYWGKIRRNFFVQIIRALTRPFFNRRFRIVKAD
jgi:glycosyltransferase involved in cell wall biosynthesis